MSWYHNIGVLWYHMTLANTHVVFARSCPLNCSMNCAATFASITSRGSSSTWSLAQDQIALATAWALALPSRKCHSTTLGNAASNNLSDRAVTANTHAMLARSSVSKCSRHHSIAVANAEDNNSSTQERERMWFVDADIRLVKFRLMEIIRIIL